MLKTGSTLDRSRVADDTPLRLDQAVAIFYEGSGIAVSSLRREHQRGRLQVLVTILRHRFASVFLMETGDLAALQAILGHWTVAMTMRYSHLVTDHLHRARAKLGTSLGTNTAEPDEAQVG